MREYRVWAPHAKEVHLLLLPQQVELRLTPGEGGYFSIRDERLRDGQRYLLRLDDRGPFPDPASRFQPEGVHGPSCFVDFDALPPQHAGFSQCALTRAVLYELHVGTFSDEGTFDGVIPHLDELRKLGITHIELMPVAHFPGSRGWGYDGVCLFAPHTSYGGPAALRRLVDACHERELAVLLDVVYNHLGPSGNYLGQFGPYFTDKYHTPWGQALNFDGPGSVPVRRFIRENALHFLEHYRFDGLRLDATHAIFDQSARHILAELSDDVARLAQTEGRPLVLIAEHLKNDPRLVRDVEAGGLGMSSQWSDDFHHALHAMLTGERAGYYQDFGPLAHVARALKEGFVVQGQYLRYRDQAFGAPPRGLSGRHFVTYVQNHDQVGNRADGERLSRLVTDAELCIASALLLLSPAVPLLFMGEEWGAETPFYFFVDHDEPELNEGVRQGRLREAAEFGWAQVTSPDPTHESAFLASRLDRSERDSARGPRFLKWYEKLIAVRRTHPCCQGDAWTGVEVTHAEDSSWLLLRRGALEVFACFEARRATPDFGDRRVLLDSRSAMGTAATDSSDSGRSAGGGRFVLVMERESS